MVKVTAREIMNWPRYCISWRRPLSGAFNIMTRYDIRVLPVVDEEERLVGLVTLRSILAGKSYGDLNPDIMNEIVAQHMIGIRLPVAHIDDEILVVMKKMVENHFENIPVVDDQERLVGEIRISDFVFLSSKISEEFLNFVISVYC